VSHRLYAIYIAADEIFKVHDICLYVIRIAVDNVHDVQLTTFCDYIQSTSAPAHLYMNGMISKLFMEEIRHVIDNIKIMAIYTGISKANLNNL
jgi:hypothetical protein